MPYEGSFDVGCFTIRKPYILITNRHEPQKKFEFVIEALARMADTIPAADLVIPGNFTAHTPQLASLAAKLGLSHRILFLGPISEQDLQRLYQEAAVYCYPAPEEDFGMGVIEAMAWGVPVVAWNHAGPTVTVEDGVTGFLAAPYDVDDYARGVHRLLVDQALRARMGSAGRIRAERLFAWERHSQILEGALWQALGEPATRPAEKQSIVPRGGELVGAPFSGPELDPR
jgi:glycosyltransferase involved in cell wall biosynthesis